MTHTKSHKRKKIFQIAGPILLLALFVGAFWYTKENSLKKAVFAPTGTKPVVVEPKPRDLPYISITPEVIKQGDPALITAEGVTTTASVKSFTFDNRPLYMFIEGGQVSALLGVELRAVPGTYPLVLTFTDGRQIKENLTITPRQIVKAPFDIPEKLGGNTSASEKELISTLAEEGKIINNLSVVWEKLWTEKFGSPLKSPLIVADEFGYTRIIGNSTTMPHKGADIKADMGTPVYAMNRGVVKLATSLRNYGNTVVIDHGAGLQTIYMHLSQINVSLEQLVEKGELIALSGDSGYTLGPHLHLTIRIWDISIDPMKFLQILGEGQE